MSEIVSIGTYLPPWTKDGRRVRGPDEDAVTMAVAAGRAADPRRLAERVVVVSRNMPLIEGGNAAVILAGLSLDADVPITEVLGGAPAVLDQVASADPHTLVIATDDSAATAAAGAVLTGTAPMGARLVTAGGQTRNLPVVTRTDLGERREYADPRLQREVGVKATVARLRVTGQHDLAVAAVAGVNAAHVGGPYKKAPINDPSAAASAAIRVLAEAVESGQGGLILAAEQSVATTATLHLGDTIALVTRDEAISGELPKATVAPGIGIPISLAAYSRAFEPKLRWEAAMFPGDDVPVFPPRRRVDDAGTLQTDYALQPLPRTGEVYTHTTIEIPVPDLPSPYTIALVQLTDSPVRVLLKVTAAVAGDIEIGQSGAVVLRRVALRSGVPDYGYAFWPGRAAEPTTAALAAATEGARQ
ncbi:Zn-ribbon domain-containing OB-fold protein [Rhodococcoides yunnanense]|uniref:OB-fold domain-containing protein n=1 Tax=Rhodococcoides yunnanense TaxID=278209 RepID=A0ABU4BKV5_9NOCA|nr:OB-fold domain-containing protein [Rhodococcus yunnanensis]MDV6264701.1 OB-fold domain-containing protein [Rhodococcus yunnanensis]